MRNHKQRLERLERGRKGRGFYLMFLQPWEDQEEAVQRFRAKLPKYEKDAMIMIFEGSGQDPPSAPPPPRPQPQESTKAPGPGPRMIFK
jgi:hypothetical protein